MNHPLPRQTLGQLMKPTICAGFESILNTPLHLPEEMSLAMHLLTQAVQPSPTNPFLERFIHDVFNDECLVNAYFFPKYLSRDSRTIVSVSDVSSLPAKVLPLEVAKQAGLHAKSMKLIQPQERYLAQLATFVYPCGLFYLSHGATVLGTGSPVPAFFHIDEMREMLLEDALHKLRSRHARLGNTLAAVLGLPHDDDIDEDQVARIAAAVYLANVKVNAIWTELEVAA